MQTIIYHVGTIAPGESFVTEIAPINGNRVIGYAGSDQHGMLELLHLPTADTAIEDAEPLALEVLTEKGRTMFEHELPESGFLAVRLINTSQQLAAIYADLGTFEEEEDGGIIINAMQADGTKVRLRLVDRFNIDGVEYAALEDADAEQKEGEESYVVMRVEANGFAPLEEAEAQKVVAFLQEHLKNEERGE